MKNIKKTYSTLETFFQKNTLEAGCDEAGRGCLAGPVFAAAVIMPTNFQHELLNDSKLTTKATRAILRPIIEKEAISWAVAKMSPAEIDKYNILNASLRSMHRAIRKLNVKPELLLIDGNRFIPYKKVPHVCIVKGDGKYTSIAAASILAKSYRDDYMEKKAKKYPYYGWQNNKGYPTQEHRTAIINHGPCDLHRKSFRLYPPSDQEILFP